MKMANHNGWQPSVEMADAGNLLMSHWRAATARPQGVFWPHPGEWHHAAAPAPEVSGTSGTLQGLHPC